jgi:PAS domain S-box-containing protein
MTLSNLVPDKSDSDDALRAIEKDLQHHKAIGAILRISLEPIPLEDQLRRILELLLGLPWLGTEGKGGIFLVEDDPAVLALGTHVGMPPGVLSHCDRLPFGKCLCGQAIATNEIVFADCLDNRHEILYPAIVPHGHYCIPITCGRDRLGVLCVYVRQGHEGSPAEDQFLRSIAAVLGGIIERKRVEEALRRSEERFALPIRGIDAGIWDWNLRTNEVYYSPLWESMLGYEKGEITPHYSEWESRIHTEDLAPVLAATQDCLEGRTPKCEFEYRLRHKDGSYRWILGRGLVVRDQEGRPHRMVGSDLDITERRRIESELRHREADLLAARRIQGHLLPQAPLRSPAVVIHGTSWAADYASGDYFDYFALADGSIVIVIADVSGHGIDAALVMASTQARLRSLCELSLGMDEVLNRLNRILFEELVDESRFVTLLLLRIDPRTRTLTYVNAGHPASYILGRTGEIKRSQECLGLPLAIRPDAEFPVGGPSSLEPGDLILLVTDGVFEARSPEDLPFGMDRVLRVVRDRIGSTSEEILEGLLDEIRKFTGSSVPQDDVTCVMVRVV